MTETTSVSPEGQPQKRILGSMATNKGKLPSLEQSPEQKIPWWRRLHRTIKQSFFGSPHNENNGAEEVMTHAEIRQELLRVQQAVDEAVNSYRTPGISAEAKPWLPDMLVLNNIPELGDLVSEAHLRGDDVWGKNFEPEYPDPAGGESVDIFLIEGYDNVRLPADFVRENAYCVVCIPKFRHVGRRVDQETIERYYLNTTYEITVLTILDGKVYRLLSDDEKFFRKEREIIAGGRQFEKSPLPLPLAEQTQFPDFAVQKIPAENERVFAWLGQSARYFADETKIDDATFSLDTVKKHVAVTINGSVAYRLRMGSVQSRKKEEKKAPVLKTSLAGADI